VTARSTWPIPIDARAVWLLGGTFDPPHEGHVGLALAARDLIEPGAWLVFVPAARSPFKSGTAQTEAVHRVEMVRRAIAGRESCAVWTDEVDRAAGEGGAPSYTIDTVRRARALAPGAALSLLIGSDQAASFHRWKDAREILELARVRVLARGDFSQWRALERALRDASFWSEAELDAWRDAFIDGLPLHEASATRIREIIGRVGVESVPDAWISPCVAEYIRAHGLYRV
jgi:nicotinate-nucleotide adenylyltransferase